MVLYNYPLEILGILLVSKRLMVDGLYLQSFYATKFQGLRRIILSIHADYIEPVILKTFV